MKELSEFDAVNEEVTQLEKRVKELEAINKKLTDAIFAIAGAGWESKFINDKFTDLN